MRRLWQSKGFERRKLENYTLMFMKDEIKRTIVVDVPIGFYLGFSMVKMLSKNEVEVFLNFKPLWRKNNHG